MNKSEHLKKELLSSLTKSLGIVSSACKALGISRTTYYKYYNEDKEFKKQVDDLGDIAIDFAESLLSISIKNFRTTQGQHPCFVFKCTPPPQTPPFSLYIRLTPHTVGEKLFWGEF